MDIQKFEKFMNIMYRLRKECPWDSEQTHDSIKAATLEEAYETVHAIDEKDYKELQGELGDLLLHIAFHSVIAEDNGTFTIDDVIQGISDKLVRRHPHIFGDVQVKNVGEILQNWEAIKLSEGRESVLDGVPEIMPSLLRAYRLQEKAAKVGFDWKKVEDVYAKVVEETNELHQAVDSGDKEAVEKEFGDLFFALINYARFIGVNPENALRGTNRKFISRFQFIEKELANRGKKITESNLEEMDEIWNESKKIYK
ncbi:MAG: nucleoside triphosphate pyrophosphohydrolase [Ignavibacteria bacterium]|nr:nucleoside triphosphate pyrophosphohydrolase [Ignavibacteria bacterium]